MKYKSLKVGMKVVDGVHYGVVKKIFKKTVHISYPQGFYGMYVAIYDLDHLQFLKRR